MIDVPRIKQPDTSLCGPTVIKSILAFNRIDATVEEIAKQCDHVYEVGCDDKGMVKAFKYYGFATIVKDNSSLEDLEYWNKHHIPVIVDFFFGGSDVSIMPDGHSGIIVDIDKEFVYLLDPSTANVLTILRDDFLRVWFDWRQKLISAEKKNLVIRQLIVAYPKRLAIK